MKRSLLGLLLALCSLAACKDTPPGQMEPIQRPEGYVEPPKPEAPKKAAEPAPDPNKVVLRWKLAAGSPMAFSLVGTPEGEAKALRNSYALERPETGDLVLRVATEGVAAPDRGTFSERGFILDGLGAADRTTATLWLELPRDPVGVGDKWSLGADLVDTGPLGSDFVEKKSERRNSAKLAALVPEGEERVATIEYDVYERVSGIIDERAPGSHGGHSHGAPARPPPPPPPPPANKKGGKKGAPPAEQKPAGPAEISAEVSFTGRGEFLVKAGRWRSWEGTLTSKTEGYTPKTPDKALAQAPSGTFKVRLTPLDSVPARLQLPEKK
ncbi:MAG TPA: hypothetical protein VK539_06520 [Myxococcaceae bacterium]|nr:hypothetical protein [Myxococcaceae bacterium]